MSDCSQHASFQWNELKKIFSMKKNICFIKRYSHIFAVISLIISISALIASFRIETFHVGIESVMGLVTALMGICATFMVGWQIFSSINVNRELGNLKLANDEFKRRVEMLNGLIAQQKEEMTKEGEARCLMKKEMDAELWTAKGLSFVDMQYFASYECFAESLYLFLEIQNTARVNSAVRNMGVALYRAERSLERIELRKKKKQRYDINTFSYYRNTKVNSEDWPITRMLSNPSFLLISEQVEELERRRSSLEERVEELKQ